MKVLELFAAGAEFNCCRRDAGRLVHNILPKECLTALPWPFAYRVPSFHAIPKIVMAGITGKKAKNPG
jgi:hypothetical protein